MLRSVKALILVTLSAGGVLCATAQAETVTNRIAGNELASNKLAANRIAANRISANRISANGVAANELASDTAMQGSVDDVIAIELPSGEILVR